MYSSSPAAPPARLATAKLLLECGASLGLCDLNGASLEKLADPHPDRQKSHVITQALDIADRGAVKSFLGATNSKFGKLDGETDDREFEFIIDVNVKGLFHVLAEALKPGVLEEPGSVVHISSMFSMRGYSKGAVFSGSKDATVGMVKRAAVEVGERNIRVNAVMPGGIDTPMLHAMRDAGAANPVPNCPIPRLGKPAEIAYVAAFLLSEESSYVTGATWAVDGGAIA